MNPIVDFFSTTPLLAKLCTQNGWPDPETLRVDVVQKKSDKLLCDVAFEEVIMEGAGCEAGRVPCWGRFCVRLNAQGQVIDAVLECGSRT